MKKIQVMLLVLVLLAVVPTGCRQRKYERFSGSFFDTFDTYTTFIGYTRNKEEFDRYFDMVQSRFRELHKLFDKYNNYEGINNIKTINDNAGIQPVKVEKAIIDLILFSREWYAETGRKTNIAMGPVLEIWKRYFDDASYDPVNTDIPSLKELGAASMLVDLDRVIVDEEDHTVYLPDKGMSLDVGAVAKGFATELVARELKEAGFLSGIISPGGNIRTIGKPLDKTRQRWGIGIQDPDMPIINDAQNTLDTIFVGEASVVSSGDYQRYYMYEGRRIHHIIDPDTLMPGENFRAVTVVAEDAATADFLSTTLFLLSLEEGMSLLEDLDGVEAIWVMPDRSVHFSEGLQDMLKSQGASGVSD
ncbi:MAG: FAD:protein FMN transferase [Caldicoprobacterales bacterium]|jgi:thiamine biosynthesis lipoprotein|nr:FAD:protein FMN transferase [Clostridiales bacterium]